MKNYYQIFNLRRKASSVKLIMRLEKIIRGKLRSGEPVHEALEAFVILGSEQLKKQYDLKIKHPKSDFRGGRLLERIAQEAEKQIHEIGLFLVFSERQFIKSYLFIIVLRSLGLDFLVFRIGYEDSNSTRRELFSRRLAQLAFLSHTLIYYGFPIILGLVEPKFFFLLIPIFLIKCYREYRRAKVEHYSQHLGLKKLKRPSVSGRPF